MGNSPQGSKHAVAQNWVKFLKQSKVLLHNGPNASQELEKITVLLPRLDKYAFDPGRQPLRKTEAPGTVSTLTNLPATV